MHVSDSTVFQASSLKIPSSFAPVRRGTWFFQDGSGLRPCEENLAAQLEEVDMRYLQDRVLIIGTHAKTAVIGLSKDKALAYWSVVLTDD